MEAGVTLAVHGWTVDAGLTLLDAENRSAGPDQGNQLPRRPEVTGRLDVERRFQKFTVGASCRRARDHSYDDSCQPEPRTGLHRPGPARRISAGVRPGCVQARIANLFDSQYETVAFYNQPGRATYLTLRYGK